MSTVHDGLLTERAWMRLVTDYAHLRGWLVYHSWRSDHSPAGYPDLTLVRGERLVFAELKSQRGELTSSQRAWLTDLERVPGVTVAVWRPDDWQEVQRALA